jgi:hypothetical protein
MKNSLQNLFLRCVERDCKQFLDPHLRCVRNQVFAAAPIKIAQIGTEITHGQPSKIFPMLPQIHRAVSAKSVLDASQGNFQFNLAGNMSQILVFCSQKKKKKTPQPKKRKLLSPFPLPKQESCPNDERSTQTCVAQQTKCVCQCFYAANDREREGKLAFPIGQSNFRPSI